MYRHTLLALALASMCTSAMAEDESTNPFSGTVGVVSDYVFRGVSQTDTDPAVQLGVAFNHESGFFAGAWASGVDFGEGSDANTEVDLYLGFGLDASESVSLSGQVVGYFYPGTDSDLDYAELLLSATFIDLVTLSVGYSNDVFASDETGIYYGASISHGFAESWTISAATGLYDFNRGVYGDDLPDSYIDYSVTLGKNVGPLDFSLALHDTNDDAVELYGDRLADARVVFSAIWSF